MIAGIKDVRGAPGDTLVLEKSTARAVSVRPQVFGDYFP